MRTGRVTWTGDHEQIVREILEAAGETADARSATSEAAGWLHDHLISRGGIDDSASITHGARDACLRAGPVAPRGWSLVVGLSPALRRSALVAR